MNIADRIQALRKAKGITQEELADRIGVSRQAVSKWESEQSLPDIDKVILLSDFFETTTDYILKGVESVKGTELACSANPRYSAMLFSIAGTLLNAVGLIAAIFIWIERRMSYATAIGLIMMACGTCVFLVGQVLHTLEKEKARRIFLLLNVWILLFIPLSCAFNFFSGLLHGSFGMLAPVPQLSDPIILYGLFWVGYIGICGGTDAEILDRMNPDRQKWYD